MHEYLFYHCTYVFHLFLFFLSSFFIVYIYYFILCSIEKNSNEKKCTRTKGKFIYFIRDRSYELILTPRSLVRLSEIVIKNIYIYIHIYSPIEFANTDQMSTLRGFPRGHMEESRLYDSLFIMRIHIRS